MIASLAFAWLAFTVTGTIPNNTPKVTVWGDLQLTTGPTSLERQLSPPGFRIQITR